MRVLDEMILLDKKKKERFQLRLMEMLWERLGLQSLLAEVPQISVEEACRKTKVITVVMKLLKRKEIEENKI